MHFQFIENKKPTLPGLWCGIWFFAVMGALLSLVDSLEYFLAVLPGVVLVIAAGFLPRKWQRMIGAGIFALCLLWLLLRFAHIGDGLGFLANRLFTLSEEGQAFCYTHFNVVRNAPEESLVLVSCALGALCLLLGGAVNLVLTLLLAIMVAYFGVAPSIVWLSILVFAAFANGLPKKERWLPAILIAAFVAATALSVQTLAPEPNVQIDNIAENLWDTFMPPIPEDPEPPLTEPSEAPEIPDIEDYPEMLETMQIPEGVTLPGKIPSVPQIEIPPTTIRPVGPEKEPAQKVRIPIVPILVTILAIATVSAAVVLFANQKRKRVRAAMYAQNTAEAIRGMYLYARRWREWNAYADEIPSEIEDIWLEAAYSDHEMTAAQLESMRSFVRDCAQNTWNNLNWWKRLAVYFYHAL
ncbi:MAG: hypothetical protein IJX01_02780 [Oscillospiraceae bacterium]|nr:hypothetical protein [Oscillospiraceae bacterium]